VAKDDAEAALQILKENGEDAYVLGEIIEAKDKVTIC
ncbi:MAG: phosphoribosylformylglycinamidine cyclo-ligase, partial [Clostridia bacterium]|nr:phosphoribosylformylglycinamidine cyclo-ligase [Clostridia bacterium]